MRKRTERDPPVFEGSFPGKGRWVEALLLGAILAVAFLGAAAQPYWRDPDLFWHLAVGREIWETGALVRTETFSFTEAGAPWADTNWLWHAAVHPLWSAFEEAAAPLTILLCAAGIVLFTALASRSAGGSAVGVALFAGAFLPALLSRLRCRPEALSLVLFAMLVWMLLTNRPWAARAGSFALGSFLLFLLWGQAHGGWAYGLLLLACSGLDDTVGALRRRDRPRAAAGRGLAALLAAVGGLLLNPYGTAPLLFPFRSLLGFADRSLPSVEEWSRTPWTPSTAPFLIACLLLLAHQAWTCRGKKRCRLFWTASQVFLALWWWRYGSYAWIALCPLGAAAVQPLLAPRRVGRWALAAAGALLGLWALSAFLDLGRPDEMDGAYPVREVRFLGEAAAGGNLLHTYEAGGYLAWTLYPGHRIFMDARYYPFIQEIREYGEAVRDPGRFRDLADRRPVEIVLFPHGFPRGRRSDFLPPERWAAVYFARYGTVHFRRIPRLLPLIRRHEYRFLADARGIDLIRECTEGRADPRRILGELERKKAEDPDVYEEFGFSRLRGSLAILVEKSRPRRGATENGDGE